MQTGKKEQQMHKILANKNETEAKEIENLKSEIHETKGDDYDEWIDERDGCVRHPFYASTFLLLNAISEQSQVIRWNE